MNAPSFRDIFIRVPWPYWNQISLLVSPLLCPLLPLRTNPSLPPRLHEALIDPVAGLTSPLPCPALRWPLALWLWPDSDSTHGMLGRHCLGQPLQSPGLLSTLACLYLPWPGETLPLMVRPWSGQYFTRLSGRRCTQVSLSPSTSPSGLSDAPLQLEISDMSLAGRSCKGRCVPLSRPLVSDAGFSHG